MKTADPNRYLNDFIALVQDGLDQFKNLDAILDGAGARAEVRKAVAEDAAFRLGALWEVFQGRWHVGAVSREPANFVDATKELLSSKLKDEVRSIVLAVNPEALTVPTHPTLAQIEAILDPNRYNLTFRDAEAWMLNSARYHSDKYQGVVKAIVSDAESASLLHLLKSLRNLLAHGSYGSKASFNRACKARPGGGREVCLERRTTH